MQKYFKLSAVMFSVIGALFSLGYAASAYEGDSYSRGGRYLSHNQFELGICVGQTLAEQGVTLAFPQPGQPPSLDSNTQAALQGAVQTCRTQMYGNGASPIPAPSSSSVPITGTPTTTPSSPIPNPSG